MIEIKVPELAESITEGTISQWIKHPGESVRVGETIAELETDKVNLEVNAEFTGVLREIVREAGETVQVGEVIALLDEQAAVPKPAVPAPREPAAAGGSPAAQPATAAASQPATVAASPPHAPEPQQPAASAPPSAPVPASPAARRLAREQGLELSRIGARDPLGRVTVDDVKAHATATNAPPQAPDSAEPPAGAAKPPVPLPRGDDDRVERIKMSRRRQTIASRLVEAQHTAAMLTTFNEVDMTAILDVRKRRKDAFNEKHQVKLGFMSFFTKTVVGALKEFPLLNAEIQGDELLVKKYYDIGIAVSAEDGLVVPVVRDADRLTFAEIEREIADLAKRARSRSLKLDELLGGTFTITNGGTFGSLLSTPILNAPQVGILGMHKIQLRPVAIDEVKTENRPMMYVALSYDHRIVDGREAVSFLVKVKELLEDPEALLLEG